MTRWSSLSGRNGSQSSTATQSPRDSPHKRSSYSVTSQSSSVSRIHGIEEHGLANLGLFGQIHDGRTMGNTDRPPRASPFKRPLVPKVHPSPSNPPPIATQGPLDTVIPIVDNRSSAPLLLNSTDINRTALISLAEYSTSALTKNCPPIHQDNRTISQAENFLPNSTESSFTRASIPLSSRESTIELILIQPRLNEPISPSVDTLTDPNPISVETESRAISISSDSTPGPARATSSLAHETPRASMSQPFRRKAPDNEVQSLSSSVTLGSLRMTTRDSSPIEIGPIVPAPTDHPRSKSTGNAKMVMDCVQLPILPLSQKKLYAYQASRSAQKGESSLKRKRSTCFSSDEGAIVDLTSPEPVPLVSDFVSSGFSSVSRRQTEKAKEKMAETTRISRNETLDAEKGLVFDLALSSGTQDIKVEEDFQSPSRPGCAFQQASEDQIQSVTVIAYEDRAIGPSSEEASVSQTIKRNPRVPPPPLLRPRAPEKSTSPPHVSKSSTGAGDPSLQPLEKSSPVSIKSQTPVSTRLLVMSCNTRQSRSYSVENEMGSGSENFILDLYQPYFISKRSLTINARHILDRSQLSVHSSTFLANLADDAGDTENSEDIPAAWMYFPHLAISGASTPSPSPESHSPEESINLSTPLNIAEKITSVMSLENASIFDGNQNNALPSTSHFISSALEQSSLDYLGPDDLQDWLVNENHPSFNLPDSTMNDTLQPEFLSKETSHTANEISTSLETVSTSPIAALDEGNSLSTLIDVWDSRSTSTHLQGNISVDTESHSSSVSLFESDNQTMTTVDPSLLGGANIALPDSLTTIVPVSKPSSRSPSPSSSRSSTSSPPPSLPDRFLPEPELLVTQRRSARERKASYKMSYALSSRSPSPAPIQKLGQRIHSKSPSKRGPPSAETPLSDINAKPLHRGRWKIVEYDDIEVEPTFCHQCRRKTIYPKMKCSRIVQGNLCGKRFCIKCSERYPDIDFDPWITDFVCPFCDEYCNCTQCCAKRGVPYLSSAKGDFQRSLQNLQRSQAHIPVMPAKSPPPTPRKHTPPTSAQPENTEFNTRLCGTMYDLDSNFICEIQDGLPVLPDHMIYPGRIEAEAFFAGTMKITPVKRKRRRIFVGEPQPSWHLADEPEEYFFVGQQRKHYLPPEQNMATAGPTYVGKSSVFKQNYINLSWELDNDPLESDPSMSSSPVPSDVSSSLSPPPEHFVWRPYHLLGPPSPNSSPSTSRSGFDGHSGFYINITSQQQKNLNPNFVFSHDLILKALNGLQSEQ